MAAYSSTTLTYIIYSAVTYYFAPNELVYIGAPTLQRNQIVQESESGQIKIQEIDTNTRTLYQFAIQMMPASDRTVGAFTIRGFDSLNTLITSTLNYQEQTVSFSPAQLATAVTARYWGASFPAVPIKRISASGVEYYGDGGQMITFRKEI
jgi:hypothetical protein